MKGLIVIGYPGIGKSTLSGWENCIDLQSEVCKETYKIRGIEKHWARLYYSLADLLAASGYTVFVSSHMEVVDMFTRYRDMDRGWKAVIFCPSRMMRDKWIERLKDRYEKTKLPKDERALKRALNYYDEDIYMLANCGLPVYRPEYIDYDLKNYIHKMQKDWCMEDEK